MEKPDVRKSTKTGRKINWGAIGALATLLSAFCFIFGLIFTPIITPFFDVIIRKLFNLQSPITTPTLSPTKQSAQTVARPITLTVLPPFPSGFSVFENFSDPSLFNSKWQVFDKSPNCSYEIQSGAYLFKCTTLKDDSRLKLKTKDLNLSKYTGISANAIITSEDNLGNMVLYTTFSDIANKDVRMYGFILRYSMIEIREYFPQENYRKEILIQKEITPLVPHTLTINYDGKNISFYLDNINQALDKQPQPLPSGSKWLEWYLEGFCAGPQQREPATLTGKLYRVDLKR